MPVLRSFSIGDKQPRHEAMSMQWAPPIMAQQLIDGCAVAHEECSEEICQYCSRRLFDRDVAKDVSQDTFLKMWCSLVHGKEILRMHAFLYRVARNLMTDSYRRKSKLSLESLRDNGYEPSVHIESSRCDCVEGVRVAQALRTIDAPSRDVLALRYVMGLPPCDIASYTKQWANCFSVRIFRRLAELRQALRPKVLAFGEKRPMTDP